MTLILPKLNRPTAGMNFRRGIWQLSWTEDGQAKTKSLGTRDVELAKVRRDAERALLIERGAVVRTGNTKNVDPTGLRYVYRNPPYQVRLPGTGYIGSFESEAEAIAARNEALGI